MKRLIAASYAVSFIAIMAGIEIGAALSLLTHLNILEW
jgi:hypothetical protein